MSYEWHVDTCLPRRISARPGEGCERRGRGVRRRASLHRRHAPHEQARPPPKGGAVRRVRLAVEEPLRRVAHLVRQRAAQPLLRVEHSLRELDPRLPIAAPSREGAKPGRLLQLAVPHQRQVGRQLASKDSAVVLDVQPRRQQPQPPLLLRPARRRRGLAPRRPRRSGEGQGVRPRCQCRQRGRVRRGCAALNWRRLPVGRHDAPADAEALWSAVRRALAARAALTARLDSLARVGRAAGGRPSSLRLGLVVRHDEAAERVRLARLAAPAGARAPPRHEPRRRRRGGRRGGRRGRGDRRQASRASLVGAAQYDARRVRSRSGCGSGRPPPVSRQILAVALVAIVREDDPAAPSRRDHPRGDKCARRPNGSLTTKRR
mmetsp:Transcript_41731/g.135318  ORF Transcript_41731/g.135318 Transcript_41731/m.135318 type:complete len:376 (+) Transcript_41731:311-1438(+)